VLMGVFGLLRGFAGANFTFVFWCTIGIAVAQPFLLNAWTAVPAKWFAVEERATAVGIITLASMLGVGIGEALTPVLVETLPIPTVQIIFGGIAAFSAILFIFLARETPPTPPCPPGMEVRALMLDGLKHAVKVRAFWMFLIVAFIGLGLFNGITTWVGSIFTTRGFSPVDAGNLGAVMLVGGILGAAILPPFSDRQHKRQRFLLLGFALAIPGLIGLTFAVTNWILFLSAFSFGFFLVSTFPIGMQYAAEITFPTPEGTSNGMVQLCGQASVLFVFVMGAMRSANGAFTPSLLLSLGLMVVGILIITQLKDPVLQK